MIILKANNFGAQDAVKLIDNFRQIVFCVVVALKASELDFLPRKPSVQPDRSLLEWNLPS